jgi:hypothetical protein
MAAISQQAVSAASNQNPAQYVKNFSKRKECEAPLIG